MGACTRVAEMLCVCPKRMRERSGNVRPFDYRALQALRAFLGKRRERLSHAASQRFQTTTIEFVRIW